MQEHFVTEEMFQAQPDIYLERAAKGPVIITREDRPWRVLMDISLYDHLKQARDQSG